MTKQDGEFVLAPHGYVYHNPDTGLEYAANHPVESGEVPDAKDVRPATDFESWCVEQLNAPASPPPPVQRGEVDRDAIEACIEDIKAGFCCPRVHGCEQNDGEFCLVRQSFARAGLIADPYANLDALSQSSRGGDPA